MKDIKSPYSAAFTAASMMYREMTAILPLFRDERATELLNREIEENNLLHINSLNSRKRVVVELQRRYRAVPDDFWDYYSQLDEKGQRVALFYVLLKAYYLLFEIHLNVAVPMYRAMNLELSTGDVAMYLNEVAAQDSFVDSWSEATRKKVISVYILMLHQAGLLENGSSNLCKPDLEDSAWMYYIRLGEAWFLEACFLPTYEINDIKERAI